MNEQQDQQQPDANQLASQAAYNQIFGQKAVDRFGTTSVELFHAQTQIEIKDRIIAAQQQEIANLKAALELSERIIADYKKSNDEARAAANARVDIDLS